MKPIFAVALAASLFYSSLSYAQTNTDATQGVNRMGAEPQSGAEKPHGSEPGATHSTDHLPEFSGNLPSTINEDRTHGVNAPGTLIGPAPENGQPDPRFPGEGNSSGGGSEINANSPSAGASQTGTGASKWAGRGMGQVGGTTSNINEGLPSASYSNDGGTSTQGSGGTGGGAGGTESNAGGNARIGQNSDDAQNSPDKMGREVAQNSRGAAPFAIGAGAVILGAFLFGVLRSRGQKRRA